MVKIDMSIAHSVDQSARMEVGSVSEDMREKCIRGNVERHAQTHITRPLVKKTRQSPLLSRLPRLLIQLHPWREGNIELRKHVARRERHLAQVGGIPGTHDDAPIKRCIHDLVDNILELIHTLAGIICLRIDVLRTEVSPLETIDGAEVAFFPVSQSNFVKEFPAAVSIPNFDSGFREGQG